MRNRQRQRGTVLVEFSMAGIASILLLITTFSIGMAMWNYHTLAYAVHETSRYCSLKGKDCILPGNTCAVSVGTIARKLQSFGVGLPDSQVNITLVTQSGIVTSCVPLNSCYSNATIWPPNNVADDNKVGHTVTVTGAYKVTSPFLFFWPGKGSQSVGTIWLPASSTQTILF